MKRIQILIILLLSTNVLIAQTVIRFGEKRENDKEVLLGNEYFAQQEYEKAAEVYAQIVKDIPRIPKVHSNYFTCLLRLKDYKTAEKYFKKLMKAAPQEPRYNVDYGILLKEQGKEDDMLEHYNEYLDQIKQNPEYLSLTASYLKEERLFETAEKAYLIGQKNRSDAFLFELAELYFDWGKLDKMTETYLDLLSTFNGGVLDGEITVVQKMLQDKLDDDEKFDALEPALYKYAQKYPNKIVYNEMLSWYYLQKKAFYKAFLQAKAIDKRKKAGGFEIMQIGQLAYNNGEYKTAVKIYNYLVDKYSKDPIYGLAKNKLIQAKEQVVKNSYPVDLEQIRSLVSDYEESIAEFGIRSNTTDAVRNMAKLHAFYLNDKDTAITILKSFIDGRYRVRQYAVDQAKLDLGDIFLLDGQPWEATLVYLQVEKTQKDRPLGHEAKLKNAKLSYYAGDFELAKGHLDVLKLATSRVIANDAMELSLLIQDNLELDTSATAMQEFASIDLLMFQNQYDQAIQKYDAMLKNFPEHSLTDEILWRQANMLVKLGKAEEAVAKLEKLLKNYGTDILGDDAAFLAGKIYEEKLKNTDKAKEIYLKILVDYPGSIYVPESRKRARLLRGDKL